MLSKEFKRKLISKILPFIGYALIRLIYLTCRKRFVLSKSIPPEPFIVALWHGELLMQPFLYRKLRKKPKLSIIISDHFDGQMIALVMGLFGLEAVRGSSSKGAVKALKASFKKIGEGYDIAITPDGPKGPRHSVADGIVAIAQKKKMPIVSLNYKASSFWMLKSWDKFIIPKPFSTLFFYAGEPFYVSDMSKEDAKEFIKKRLLIHAV